MKTPSQNLHYIYVIDRVVRIEDRAQGKIIENDYDREGRRISCEIRWTDGTVLQEIRSNLDALGRTTWSYDTNATLVVGFDAVGNRRCVLATVYYKSVSSFGHISDKFKQVAHWYTYDEADRVLVDNGKLKDGRVIVDKGCGIQKSDQVNLQVQDIAVKAIEGASGANRWFNHNEKIAKQDKTSSTE